MSLGKQLRHIIISAFSHIFLDNEVFEFKCSTGLLFDIHRQICDFKAKVDNCDQNTGRKFLNFTFVINSSIIMADRLFIFRGRFAEASAEYTRANLSHKRTCVR